MSYWSSGYIGSRLVRVEMGLQPDPLLAYRADNYAQKVAEERGLAAVSGSAIQ